jgi:hypothetical protein
MSWGTLFPLEALTLIIPLVSVVPLLVSFGIIGIIWFLFCFAKGNKRKQSREAREQVALPSFERLKGIQGNLSRAPVNLRGTWGAWKTIVELKIRLELESGGKFLSKKTWKFSWSKKRYGV